MIYPVNQILRERAFPLGFYIASSVLKKNDFEVKCLDLLSSDDWKNQLIEQLTLFNPHIIGFSVCGADNYKFALEIVQVFQLHKQYQVFFGGQHIQPPTEIESEYYKGITGYIENIKEFSNKNINGSVQLEAIDFSLVDNLLNYLPAVEISRGCWNLCKFCNADNLYFEKPLDHIQKELQILAEIYPKDTILTLGGSNHIFKTWKKRGLVSLLKEYSTHFRYNFNCGVEAGWETVWEDILSFNVWNIFVGIEAANETTLLNMHKTRTPKEYIKKASDLLYRCAKDNVYAFVTYIYGYPFDNKNDLDILDNFILTHSHKNIVQLGEPIQAYPGTKLLLERDSYKKQGITFNNAFETTYNPNIEYYYLDVSEELTFDYLKNRSLQVFTTVNQNKDSFYRCCGFRNFATYELFDKNIDVFSAFYKK